MIGQLLILGFTLSLDNFRTAIALGGLQPGLKRSVKIAVVFGFWDGVAPVVGILVGQYASERIGETADGPRGQIVVIRGGQASPGEMLSQTSRSRSRSEGRP